VIKNGREVEKKYTRRQLYNDACLPYYKPRLFTMVEMA
jgi:hypothetical protein